MKNYLEKGKIIHVQIDFDGKEDDLLPKGTDTKYEAYKLEIKKDGKVHIEANYYPGVIRALDTFSQLFKKDEKEEGMYILEYAPIKIDDEPSYAYRGVMLDTSREYFYVDTLKQMLDGMMISRLNIFHWHFMDADSFPLYMKSYPNLTDHTAFSPEEIYTQEMIKDIVAYARIRGIKVIPEMGGPGNLNSLSFYPKFKEFMSCTTPPVVNGDAYGSPLGGMLDPMKKQTYEFYENLFKEVHEGFKCEFCHLGGIIPNGECLEQSEEASKLVNEGGYQYRDIQTAFETKRKEIMKNVTKMDMETIYWYQNEGIDYSEDDILQFWGQDNFMEAEMKKYPKNKFILSPMMFQAS